MTSLLMWLCHLFIGIKCVYMGRAVNSFTLKQQMDFLMLHFNILIMQLQGEHPHKHLCCTVHVSKHIYHRTV
jgi:hypothetical protein